MKNTREAVRYGIETLGVSPDRMFALFESSNGYDGQDYDRWLANEIIKIAEKDGVGYSQLLVKKFSIIQSLMEEYADNSVRDEWARFMSDTIGGDIYSVGIEGVGDALEDVDWFNGLDYDSENSEFVKERLPEDVRDAILENKPVSFFCKLSGEAVGKDSELYRDAMGRGIPCRNEGALMLYRFCSLITAFEGCTGRLGLAILAPTGFLSGSENARVWEYFLSYFKYCFGCVIEAGDLLKDSYTGGEYVFMVCKPRILGDPIQDGVVLRRGVLSDGELELIGRDRRYTRSGVDMLSSLINRSCEMQDTVPVIGESGLQLGLGVADAMGYMQYDRARNLGVSAQPVVGVRNLPITRNNFFGVVVYYAVTKSLERFGFSKSITEVVDGSPEYAELAYNCLPLFLFDSDNSACDRGVLRVNGQIFRAENRLDVLKSEFIVSELEKGESYFSFEAKEMISLCRGFIRYYRENGNDDLNKSFRQLREESDYEELNRQYLQDLTNLKDYVSTLYRRIEG